MVELDASSIYGEAPSNESSCFMASFHERGQFSFQRVDVGYAPFGTAVMHGGELDLRHIQPTAVLRREVPFDPIEQPTGLVRGNRFVKRSGPMRAQIVQHQAHATGLRVETTSSSPLIPQAKSFIVRCSVTTSSRQPRFGSQKVEVDGHAGLVARRHYLHR